MSENSPNPKTPWPDDDAPIRSTRSIQTPYGEQDENGTDLSLIRSLLRLTPEERILIGERARRGTLRLREYGRAVREKRSSPDR